MADIKLFKVGHVAERILAAVWSDSIDGKMLITYRL